MARGVAHEADWNHEITSGRQPKDSLREREGGQRAGKCGFVWRGMRRDGGEVMCLHAADVREFAARGRRSHEVAR